MIKRWFSGQGRGALAALLVSLAGAGFSAHAGLTKVTTTAAAPAAPVPVGYEAQEHFPGAALLYLDEPDRPLPGTTGTVDLPALPLDATISVDASVRPARPFLLRGSALDNARALQCLTSAIYYEAASEPDDGQAAVAQVVLNRVRHPSFPATVCGVVYQGSEKRGCQFSFACDGSLARVPMRAAWDRARRAAARALAGRVFAPVGLATHYHTYAVTPSWNRSLVMTDAVGAHFFHRWKGWWGTSAAFSQVYAGGEPVPGPHAPSAISPTPGPVTVAAVVLLKTPAPAVPEVVTEYKGSGAIRDEYAAAGESQILDKWKDSGKPLR